MTNIHPVSLERHGRRAWTKSKDFAWARHDQVIPVSLQEATQLMMTLPLAFLSHEGNFQFLALLGLQPSENVWVHTDGSWLAPRMPNVLQHYPFRLLRDAEGRGILGVDEAGLLAPGATGGTPLYDADNKPAAELANILESLVKADLERQHSRKIVEVLNHHGLLEPWDLRVQIGADTRKIDGLHRINEQKLNETSADVLLELRNTHALLLAYMQLLSMQQVQGLLKLTEAHAVAREQLAREQKPPKADPDDGHGIISFSNL